MLNNQYKKIKTMKAQKFKLSIFILLILAGFSLQAKVQDEQVSKTLKKEYAVNTDTELKVNNKFGKVDIQNWDKDQLSIDVLIKVKHRNKEKAQEMLDYITVEFSKEGNVILAETDINRKIDNSGFIFNFDDESAKDYSIDYTIMMPAYLNIDISNKFGDVFINEVTGLALIDVKYGNLKANKIVRNKKPYSTVELAYSEGIIEECSWLKLDLSYSELEMDKSQALIVMSKFSELYVENVNSVVAESKFGNIEINSVANFVTTSSYTDFKFNEVSKRLDIDTKYGDCEVDYVPPGFEKINITNRYGSVDVEIDESAEYRIKGEASFGDINYPSNGVVSKEEDTNDMSIRGYIGTNPKASAEIFIDTKFGSVDIK